MMDYLKKYNFSDEQIAELVQIIKNQGLSVDLFEFEPEKVMCILDMFVEIGVKNIYGIISTDPSMFYGTEKSIRRKISKYENKEELARLLDEDPYNLVLIGIL